MFSLGWEEGGVVWGCRRRLWDWEVEMIGECRRLLDNFVLQTDVVDGWQWLHDVTGGYTVRGAYYILTSQAHHIGDDRGDLVWHKHVPLKVSILAWRLLRDRLPTKKIFSGVVFYNKRPYSVSRDAEMKKQLLMCSFIAIFLVLYGNICGIGLVILVLIRIMLMTISYSLQTL